MDSEFVGLAFDKELAGHEARAFHKHVLRFEVTEVAADIGDVGDGAEEGDDFGPCGRRG